MSLARLPFLLPTPVFALSTSIDHWEESSTTFDALLCSLLACSQPVSSCRLHGSAHCCTDHWLRLAQSPWQRPRLLHLRRATRTSQRTCTTIRARKTILLHTHQLQRTHKDAQILDAMDCTEQTTIASKTLMSVGFATNSCSMRKQSTL